MRREGQRGKLRETADVSPDLVDSMKYAPLPPAQQINKNNQNKFLKKSFILLIIIINTATAINYNYNKLYHHKIKPPLFAFVSTFVLMPLFNI